MSVTRVGPRHFVGIGARPAQVLTHPVMMLSLVVLVINDHWAKAVFANHVTGKLSDAAGSLLLAGLLAVMWSLWVGWLTTGRLRGAAVTVTNAWVAVGVVVAGVAVAKTTPMGANLAAWGLGCVRWPLDLALGVVSGNAVAASGPVMVVVDATDVLAALFAFLLVVMVSATQRPHVQPADGELR
jgi:hypothetical protein